MEHTPHVHVADMLKKVQDVLSSLTLTKLDLMSFLEDITTELKLLKHRLQLPYLGHKFSITTLPPPPSNSSDDEILDLVSIYDESPKDNDYVPVPFGSYLSPEAFNQELTEDKEVE